MYFHNRFHVLLVSNLYQKHTNIFLLECLLTKNGARKLFGAVFFEKNDIRTNEKINQSLKKWLRSYFNAQKRKLHFTFMLKKWQKQC